MVQSNLGHHGRVKGVGEGTMANVVKERPEPDQSLVMQFLRVLQENF